MNSDKYSGDFSFRLMKCSKSYKIKEKVVIYYLDVAKLVLGYARNCIHICDIVNLCGFMYIGLLLQFLKARENKFIRYIHIKILS